jgi:hypothetical protein
MIEHCFPHRLEACSAVDMVVKSGFSIIRCTHSRIACNGPRGMVLHLDFATLTFKLRFTDGVLLDSYMLSGKHSRRKPEYLLADLQHLFRCVPLRDYTSDGRHAGVISDWFDDKQFGFIECYGRRDFMLRIAQVPAGMLPLVKEGTKIRFRAGKLGPYQAEHGCLPAADVIIVRTGVLIEMPSHVRSRPDIP